MWEPVFAVGIAVASLVAVSRHLTVRRSARDLRVLRAENDSLLEEIRRTEGLGDFKARFEGSEEQLRTIADNLPVMIVRWDRERRYTFANRLAEEWYGRPAPQIVGKTIPDLFGDALPGSVTAAIDAGLSGQAVRFEAAITYPDGNNREVEIAYVPDLSPEGRVKGCFGLVQDISERKAAERAVRESEARLRAIIDNSPVAINLKDRQGRYILANREYLSWYGFELERIAGKTSRDIFAEPEAGTFVALDREVLETGQPVTRETETVHRDGTVHRIVVNKFPLPDADSNIVGICCVDIDITEIKDLQSELLRKERLAVLGQLTGTVAHELRNPLGAVVMSLGVIRQGCKEAGLDLERAALTRADRGLQRCETIVTELLDFARARGLQRRPTALDSWLGRVLDEHDIPDGIRLVRKLQDTGVEAQIDREQLRRAVINVVDNACQAMTQARPGDGNGALQQLAVTVRELATRVELEFADTGPGIRDDVLPQVMEPLFSTKPFGTGLGLPTVKRIMEEHGGGVEVDGAQPRGTRVILWLPAGVAREGGVAR